MYKAYICLITTQSTEKDDTFLMYGESWRVAPQTEKPRSMISQSGMRTATDKPNIVYWYSTSIKSRSIKSKKYFKNE